MKNKLGKRENLREYHENGKLAYKFIVSTVFSSDYSYEKTYDNQGRPTSCKDSKGYSWKKTYDNRGRITFFEDSSGVYWKRIYNENGTFEQIDL